MQSETPHATRCGAKTRSGEPCKNPPVRGRTRCRMHGGKSPRGVESATFKTGRYSKDLPQRLIQRYEASLQDPERLALDREIALTDARLGELLAGLDAGESAWRWKQVAAQWKRYEKGRRTGDVALMTDALTELEPLIAGGNHEVTSWAEIHDLMQKRRLLVESERRRLVEAHQIISIEEALAVVHAIAASVERHVSDDAAKKAIAADLRAIMGAQPDRLNA